MKKARVIFALLAVLTLMFMAGCGQNDETDDTGDTGVSAQQYIEKAQKYIDEENYNAAIDILQLGLEAIEDEALEKMLSEIIERQAAESAEIKDTDERESKSDSETSSPDEDQMTDDILAAGINCFYLDNQAEYLDISELELLRRKTDADYDESYVSVLFENDYYTVSAEMTLYYGLYDVGGWVLEDCVFTHYQSAAKMLPVTSESFAAQMCNYFNSCEVLDRYSWINTAGNYCESISFGSEIKYECWSIHLKGDYSFEFCDDIWHEYPLVAVEYVDWSPLIGTWEYREQNFTEGIDHYSVELRLNITDVTQISDNQLQITYNGHTYFCGIGSSLGYIDEDFPEKTRTVKIYASTENILGNEIKLPCDTELGTPLTVPWLYEYYPLKVCIDGNDGPYLIDVSHTGNVCFSKVISTDDLQGAVDKLNNLNNG